MKMRDFTIELLSDRKFVETVMTARELHDGGLTYRECDEVLFGENNLDYSDPSACRTYAMRWTSAGDFLWNLRAAD